MKLEDDQMQIGTTWQACSVSRHASAKVSFYRDAGIHRLSGGCTFTFYRYDRCKRVKGELLRGPHRQRCRMRYRTVSVDRSNSFER